MSDSPEPSTEQIRPRRGRWAGFLRRWPGHWYAIPVALASWYCTRGPDGQFDAFWVLFGLLVLGYLVVMLRTFPGRGTLESIGHMLTFSMAAALGLIGSDLQGMAGMLVAWIFAAIFLMVLLGAVVLRFRPRKGIPRR